MPPTQAESGRDAAPRIRPVTADDLPPLRDVLDAAGLFPSDLLAPMIQPFLEDPDCPHLWLTATIGAAPVALAYCEPERMTDRAWNLLAIAVHPDQQGRGVGRAILRHLEAHLAQSGQRLLLVETSSLPEYARTRAFYAANGYAEAARIPDFYRDGEDKIVFQRKLGA